MEHPYPAAALYALRPDFITWGVRDVIPNSKGFQFLVVIELDGVEYVGCGPNKKKAKHDACRQALEALPSQTSSSDQMCTW